MLELLKRRFENYPELHPGLSWEAVRPRLAALPDVLEAVARMEDTGGEPMVLSLPGARDVCICDCARESPKGRRSLCYDDEALHSRKRNPPAGSAAAQAAEMGVALMDETLYYALQEVLELDLKTSSWVLTPDDVRQLGGAVFCERRYGRVFTFHNGADSYYGARGWRGVLRV